MSASPPHTVLLLPTHICVTTAGGGEERVPEGESGQSAMPIPTGIKACFFPKGKLATANLEGLSPHELVEQEISNKLLPSSHLSFKVLPKCDYAQAIRELKDKPELGMSL